MIDIIAFSSLLLSVIFFYCFQIRQIKHRLEWYENEENSLREEVYKLRQIINLKQPENLMDIMNSLALRIKSLEELHLKGLEYLPTYECKNGKVKFIDAKREKELNP